MARYATFALAALLDVGIADAGVTAPPTSERAYLVQVKEFAADRATVFRSVLEVFQEIGYSITTVDSAGGFITAESPTNNSNKDAGDLFWGGSTGNNRVTATVEEFGDGRTRVRLNIVYRKRFPRSLINHGQFEEPVTDPGVYADAFGRIEAAVYMRRPKPSDHPSADPH